MWSKTWLLNALHIIALAFLVTFVGALASAGVGVVNLATVKAAGWHRW